MKKLNNPHDKFLKETLSRKENAVGFIQNYLPQEIVTMIDLDILKLKKTAILQKIYKNILLTYFIKLL